MKLHDNGDYYEYDLGPAIVRVGQLVIDAALTLELVSPEIAPDLRVSIRVGGQFRCTDSDGVASEFDPERNREGLGPVLGLWTAHVSGIRIGKSGALVVTFADDRTLMVRPDPKFEAWTLNDDEGLLVVGGPEDRVSIFRPPDDHLPKPPGRYREQSR